MSTALSFKSLLFIHTGGVELWTQRRKTWTLVSSKLSLETPPPAEIQAHTQGDNVLVLVSDAFAGHIQFTSPNKKELLTDQALGSRLQSEFQVDVGQYEFAMQRSTLTRTEMQISVSGIEASVYQQILAWMPGLMPRKFWVMPFGWFVSPLKSVEPVLLAIEGKKDQIFVSHHYLGVDDAREISLADLAEYVQSRKDERKETHLLYFHGSSKLLKKIETALEDIVAVHPLLVEQTEGVLEEILMSVFEKGPDVLGELLHFEEDGLAETAVPNESGLVAPQAPKLKAPELDDATDQPSDVVVAPVLPTPTPPQPVSAARSEVVEELLEEAEETAETESTPKDSTLTESPSLTPVVAVIEPPTASRELIPEEPALTPDIVESEVEPETEVVAEEELDPISRLSAQKQQSAAAQTDLAGSNRYREVEQKRSWGAIVFVFAGVVALTVLIGGAIFWSQQVKPTQQALIPSENATPTPTPAPTATPTPEPKTLSLTEKKQLSTVVRNATTKAGLAGRYDTALEKSGWNVTSAGNATGKYEDAAVYIFTANDAAFETLSRELGEVKVRRLTENSEGTAASIDVVVVLNQAVEPSITPIDQVESASGSATTR